MHTFSSIPSSQRLEILVDKSDEEYNVSHSRKMVDKLYQSHVVTIISLLVFNGLEL